jgi:hypothetical protein
VAPGPALRVLDDARAFAAGIDQSPCDGCDACGARCIADVPMLEPEFTAIRAFVSGPEGGAARAAQRQEKRLPYPGTAPADGAFYTACRFRDAERGRCAIYPVRPFVCRLFGHAEWLPCPIAKVPATAAGALDAMRRYGEAPQHTYEEWLRIDGSRNGVE